jgi:hypothetical protein
MVILPGPTEVLVDGQFRLPFGDSIISARSSIRPPEGAALTLPDGSAMRGGAYELAGGALVNIPDLGALPSDPETSVILTSDLMIRDEKCLLFAFLLPAERGLVIPPDSVLVLHQNMEVAADITLQAPLFVSADIRLANDSYVPGDSDTWEMTFDIILPRLGMVGATREMRTRLLSKDAVIPRGNTLPIGFVFPAKTEFPAGSRLATGNNIPPGTTVPRSTLCPQGLVIPMGTRHPKGAKLPRSA